MKKILVVVVLAFCSYTFSNAQSTLPSYKQIISEAKTVAKKENKAILIYFHASWCKWCKKFEAAINNDNCKDYFNNNFVIRDVDVNEKGEKKNLENPGGSKWLKKNGYAKKGIPFYLFMDKNGNIVETALNDKGDNIGYPAMEKEVEEFIAKLKTVSTVTPEEETQITNTFVIKK